MTDQIFHECKYCFKKLSTKENLEKHTCRSKERWEYLSTKKGYQAFNDYSYWLNKKKSSVPKKQTFVDSRFFNSFSEFQIFVLDKGIPDKKMYMDFMISNNVSPMLWRMQESYDMFIRFFDESVETDVKCNLTFKLITELASILECKRAEVFGQLLASDVSRLVFERRLTPWVLLSSKEFLSYMHNLNSVENYRLLYSTIDVDIWKIEFKKNPEKVKNILNKVEEFFNEDGNK